MEHNENRTEVTTQKKNTSRWLTAAKFATAIVVALVLFWFGFVCDPAFWRSTAGDHRIRCVSQAALAL